MLIDWFTVFAQLVNFLILMALLKRFLYKPVMQALKDREAKIAQQLEEAREIKAAAERERIEYVEKIERFERQRDGLLKQVHDDAAHEREKLIKAARTESDELRSAWQQALKNEQNRLHRELMRNTREEVFAISRKTLADLASVSLEQRICEAFLQRLHTLDDSEKNRLSDAIQASPDPIRVRSTFALMPEQQSAIKQAVSDVFKVNATIEFDVDADQISGIELSANGRKLSWNIAGYLQDFENSIGRALTAKTVSQSHSGTDTHVV
ncbi:F0F1 ATP synthase subunit B [Methylotuvimicrobium sp. KM2]|uniref:F0F1 ATP synthase subunit B family protein n=1 Tax=Methylotuvimicrobium sp. KM2 TaxID=3133976 RepID=UPI0031010ABE